MPDKPSASDAVNVPVIAVSSLPEPLVSPVKVAALFIKLLGSVSYTHLTLPTKRIV